MTSMNALTKTAPVLLADIDTNSLSWADDLVVISKSKGLQNALDCLNKYCQK